MLILSIITIILSLLFVVVSIILSFMFAPFVGSHIKEIFSIFTLPIYSTVVSLVIAIPTVVISIKYLIHRTETLKIPITISFFFYIAFFLAIYFYMLY